MSAGIIKLDSQKRVSLGKYTDLPVGAYLRVERTDAGILLTPLHLQPAEAILHEGENVIAGAALRGAGRAA